MPIAALLAVALACAAGAAPAQAGPVERAPLSTDGARIVDRHGERIVIQGVNWFGFETSVHVAHGLWARDYSDMLAQIRSLGFNAIRLPFSVEAIRSNSISSVNTSLGRNSELAGKTPLQALDLVVAEARRQDLLVVLDLHSLADDSFTQPLWYGDGYTEDDWVDAWRTMANRYGNDPNVVAADLKNEPHGEAQWGTGAAPDWRRAAERGGNAVHEIAPHWLAIVEGIEGPAPGQQLDRHWWGGNLEGVRSHPIALEHDRKLVYSPHEYGPGVFAQPWFSDPQMQAILYDRWQQGFDHIADAGTAPILIGEFGGRGTGTDTAEGIWQRQLMDFLGRRGHSWTYWSWNPNSGDTGGVLADDWQTPVPGKLALLQQLQRREPIDFPRTTPVPDDGDVGGGPPGSGAGGGDGGDSPFLPGGEGGGGGDGGDIPPSAAPETRITDGPPARGRARRVRFKFESAGADSFECRLDDGAWESCESPQRMRVPRGSHRFRVRAIAGGAADPTPASHPFRVRRR
jgi:endoglucanase